MRLSYLLKFLLVQAQYHPAVQIAYEFLMSYGSTPMVSIIDCVSGYLYDYFTNEYPVQLAFLVLDHQRIQAIPALSRWCNIWLAE
jgi:hypothetical protein